jgi:proline iminopeptidase
VLFIHGGPGQSCYPFMHTLGDRLAERLRIIGLDQRGILRSDPLADGTPVTVQELIDDFEGLRQLLGIPSWTVLGHSAGGGYAIRYAHQHPEPVHAAIYDCPAWDCDHTDRHRLPIAADVLERHGQIEAAQACRELVGLGRRLTAEDETPLLLQELGDHYNELFFHQAAHMQTLECIAMASGFTDRDWSKGRSHRSLMVDMYDSKLSLLPELRQPSLLVHGRYDVVLPPRHVDEFRAKVPNGRVHTFENAGHFPCIEEPEEYVAVVTEFVTSNAHPSPTP